MKKVLSKELLSELKTELSNTSFATVQEINTRHDKTPGLARINNEKYKITYNVGMDHYSLDNNKLNKILKKISGRASKYLISIHTNESIIGSETYSHYDTNSGLSLSILLEDNFEGANLIVDGKNIDLVNEGDYILFEGHKVNHYVTPVTSGKRKVLVLFYEYERGTKIM
jgi:hypothetical protein